jgi:hypothetical protein
MAESLKIIALCVVAAILYGIVHDQVTARVCVEYFTIGHPRILPTDDPTLLGLFWGIVATWWAGLGLGVLLAAAARGGQAPKRTARSLVGMIGGLLAIMAGLAITAGAAAWSAAGLGWIVLVGPWAESVPVNRQQAFLAVGAAHAMSYVVAGLGGAMRIWQVWRSRRPAAQHGLGHRPLN